MTRTSVPSVPTREQLMKLVTAEITTGGHLDIRKAHDLWNKQGAFARGRIVEAKSIAKAIGGIL